jgi:uncharacterized protein with PIN domain
MKFLTDEMEGNLTSWLRFLGYDTKYAKDFEVKYGTPVEDDILIEQSLLDYRILITRDREMANRFRKKFHLLLKSNPEVYKKFEIKSNEILTPLLLLNTDDFVQSMVALYLKFNLSLHYVPELARCSACNSTIRKVRNKADYQQKIPNAVYENNQDFWVCENENCNKLYWIGGHFEDIYRKLDEIKEIIENIEN